MSGEAKVIISIIVAVWLFGMGVIAGESYKKTSVESPVTQQAPGTSASTVAAEQNQPNQPNQPTQPTTGSSVQVQATVAVAVTDTAGQPVKDENGQTVTQYVVQTQQTPDNNATTGDMQGSSTTQVSSTADSTSVSQPAQEVTATKPEGGGQQATSPVDGRQCADVQAIKSGTFYILGTETGGGNEEPLKLDLAARGQDVQVSTEISGADISVLVINDELYLVYDGTYCKLSATLMNTVGIDLEEMKLDASFLTDLFKNETDVKVEQAELKGEAVTKTSYNTQVSNVVPESGEVQVQDVLVELYTKGDRLLEIRQYLPGSSEPFTTITVDSVSAIIPPGMLTTDGLQKKNFVSFFKGLFDATGGLEEVESAQ